MLKQQTLVVFISVLLVTALTLFLMNLYITMGIGFIILNVGPVSAVSISSKETIQRIVNANNDNNHHPFLIVFFHQKMPPQGKLLIWFNVQQKLQKSASIGCDQPRALVGKGAVTLNVYIDKQRLIAQTNEAEVTRILNTIIAECFVYAIASNSRNWFSPDLLQQVASSASREIEQQPMVILNHYER